MILKNFIQGGKIKIMIRIILFAITFLIFNILFVFSANMVGVIYKKDENYFYSKLYSNLPKDTILDVYRSYNKVGKVKIVSLIDNVALLSVVEGNIQTGDLLYYDSAIKNSNQQEQRK